MNNLKLLSVFLMIGLMQNAIAQFDSDVKPRLVKLNLPGYFIGSGMISYEQAINDVKSVNAAIFYGKRTIGNKTTTYTGAYTYLKQYFSPAFIAPEGLFATGGLGFSAASTTGEGSFYSTPFKGKGLDLMMGIGYQRVFNSIGVEFLLGRALMLYKQVNKIGVVLNGDDAKSRLERQHFVAGISIGYSF